MEDISAETVPSKPIADHSVDPGTWGHTYFVQRGERIKIGHSAVPKQRLSHLGPVAILAVVPNTIISEGDAHKRFAHLRIEKEWFRVAPDLLEFIEQVKEQVKRESAGRPKAKTPEINLEFENVRRDLIAKRLMVDSKTPIGHRYSNVIEMLENYRTATGDQRANLAKSIQRTMTELAIRHQ